LPYVQPADAHPVVDGTRLDAEREELGAGDPASLRRGDGGDSSL
jgi:hypothetical protein